MKVSDNKLDQALARQKPGVEPRPADEFWADFKARARLRTQDAPARPRQALAWVTPLACAAALVLAVGVYMLSPPRDINGDVIKSVEVVASHSAVFIMEDKESKSAIVWIVDMETDPGNGGDT